MYLNYLDTLLDIFEFTVVEKLILFNKYTILELNASSFKLNHL